jgi:hypothetical protein
LGSSKLDELKNENISVARLHGIEGAGRRRTVEIDAFMTGKASWSGNGAGRDAILVGT